jgi:nucleolar protein 53
LLRQAHEKEEKRVREAEKFSDIKERISKLQVDEDENVAPGMKLDVVTTELEERTEGEDSILPARKVPERKTRLQRQKAARHAAEVWICAYRKLFLTLTFSNGH